MILGNDAVLAAAPATAVQLAHACLAYGFELAVPASWGDELIATETLRQLSTRGSEPAVQCACPYVAARLLATGADLAPFLVSVVSPPIATARYVRAAYGTQPVHITYVGACPVYRDGAPGDIDVALLPSEFFRKIAARGISLSEQPRVFDSVVPPDRRRWCSVPGGLPSPDVLWKQCAMRSVIELDADDITAELAQHLLARENVLVDLAPRMRCACSGVTASTSPRSARSSVTVLEPPRAFAPIVDDAVTTDLARASFATQPAAPPAPSIEPSATAPDATVASAEPPLSAPQLGDAPPIDVPPNDLPRGAPYGSGASTAPEDDRDRSAVRRRTPTTAMPRVSSGSFPRIASAEFRALPRAYVGKRRATHLPRADSPAIDDHTAKATERTSEPDPARAMEHEASRVEIQHTIERETMRIIVAEPPVSRIDAGDAPDVVAIDKSEHLSLGAGLESATEGARHINGAGPTHGMSSRVNGLATEEPPLPPPAAPPATPAGGAVPGPGPSAAPASPRRPSVTVRQTPGRGHPTSYEAFRHPPSNESEVRTSGSAAVRVAGTVIALIALLGLVLALYTLVMN